MKRLLVLLVICNSFLIAQTDSVYTGRRTMPEKKKERNDAWKDNVTFGGNFNGWFGNPTYVFLSPEIGYTVLENFNLGIGGIYSYQRYISSYYGNFSQSVYGIHTYARYTMFENAFVQVQNDQLNQPAFNYSDPGARTWVNYLLVGAGFRQNLGERSAIVTSLMYNLTPHRLSIYPSRFILQFGFVAGF